MCLRFGDKVKSSLPLPWKRIVGEEVQFHSFITSAIDADAREAWYSTQLKILSTSLVAVDHFMCENL